MTISGWLGKSSEAQTTSISPPSSAGTSVSITPLRSLTLTLGCWRQNSAMIGGRICTIHTGAGADIDGAAGAALDGVDLRQRVAIFEVHQADAAGEDFPERGRRDAGRHALEQRDAEIVLELTDALGQRRLADMQLVRRRRDAFVLHDGEEMAEQA